MFLRACAMALEIATGTSRALPKPKPTRPAPSPTTVSAVKPNCRPPLTTLAVRLTATSFSTNSSAALRFFHSCHMCLLPLRLKLKSRFARRFGQRLDAAVVLEPGAVEGDRASCRRPWPARRSPGRRPGRPRRCRCPSGPRAPSSARWRRWPAPCCRLGIEQLRIDVARRAMHGQPGATARLRICARVLTARRRRRFFLR